MAMATTAEPRNLEEENRKLRRMLATLYAGIQGLYYDDGELQDNRARPYIDFRRDSPDEIQEKMFLRANPWAVSSAEREEFKRIDAKLGRDRTLEEISRHAVLGEKIKRQAEILQAIH